MGENRFKVIVGDELRQALDHFTACLNIRIAYFTPSGDELVVGMSRPICEYCRLLRHGLNMGGECVENDRRGIRMAYMSGQVHAYTCHAGLIEAVKPVYLGSSLVGYIMMGQFRDTRSLPDGVFSRWQKIQGDDHLRDAFLSTPYYSPAKLEHIIGLFSILVDNSIAKNQYRLQGGGMILELEDYVRRNLDRNIGVVEAASHFHRSVSGFSHAVKKMTGKSFKTMLIEAKLREAERLMTANPDENIATIAAKVGYRDQFNFSRIYRRYRGQPPLAFKNAVRSRISLALR